MSRLIFSIRKFIVSFIPKKVSDRFVLWVMHVFALKKGLPSSLIEAHLKANRIGWQRYIMTHVEDPFIEYQNDMDDLYYGKRFKASYNACEVIAAYNALLDLTDHKPDTSFPDLLAGFERRGLVRRGAWGTDMRCICRFFEENGFAVHKLTGRQITPDTVQDLEGTCRTFIMTAYNDRDDIMKMIHTVSVTRGEKRFFAVHNAEDDKAYGSLLQAVLSFNHQKGRVLQLIGIV